jgi:outer membrane receptor protein involved in Fe transport
VTRLLSAALFVLALALPAASQEASAQIGGSVVDTIDTPLDGIVVSLVGDGETRTAVTDGNGRFRFDGVRPGSYRVSAKGEHRRESAQRVVLKSGATFEIRFELLPGFAETVTVTAARREQSVMSAPASVSVIGSREIEASPSNNVPDLLRAVPGMNIVQFSAREFDINTRASTGVLSNSMLVMVDGRSVVQPFYGNVHWDLMTVAEDEINQIEVLRSPASALWGANALNGVVNIRTKSPRQMLGLRGNLAFGERGTKSADVIWADAGDRFSYKLSGSYFEQDPWERDNLLPDGSPMPREAVYQNRGTRQPKFDARIDWDADRSRVWSFRGGVAGANGLTQSALGPGEFGSGSYSSYAELDRSSNDFDFKAYWNRLKSPYQIVLFNLAEHATSDTYAVDVTRRLKIGNHQGLTFGGSLAVDRFDISIAPDDRGRVDGAAFLEDSVSVSPLLSFVVGGRLDKFDTANAVFAPRLGAVLSPKPAHSFRVAYNRAYRAPSLLENFVNVALPAVVALDPPFFYSQLTLGSTTLEMEKQDAVEVGYTGVFGSHATLSATGYNQRISNKIWFLPVSFYGPGAPPPGWPGAPTDVPLLPKVFSFVNLGRIRDRGVELAGQVEWAPISVRASYTFQTVPVLKSGIDLPLQINQPPRHQVGVGLTYRVNRWIATGDVHYSGRAFWADVFTQPFWGDTDAYRSVNARVSYRLPNRPWDLWLSATNLLDEKIKSHVFGDIVRRRVTAGVHWQ